MAARATQEFYLYSQIGATALVKSGAGMLAGVFVSSVGSSPLITIYDGLSSAGTLVISAFTPTAAKAYPFPIQFGTGLYIVVGGVLQLTVFYQ